MKHLSIRWRFTLFYSLLLAGTLALFGVMLYVVQASATFDALKRDLAKSGGFVSGLVQNNGSVPNPPQQPQLWVENPEDPDAKDEMGHLPEREILRVLDKDGLILANLRGSLTVLMPLQAEQLSDVVAGKDVWSRASVNGDSYLVYNHPVTAPDGSAMIVQVARPLNEQERNLQFLGFGLLGFSAVMVLVALAVGWWFSGVTLAPIQKITDTAEAIGSEKNFSHRVAYDGPRDEVGKLAHTLNEMLGQLQASYSQVAHSLEMQRDFVADVSHELRTPLTTLSGNVGLLRRTPPLPANEQADILADVSEEADRMIRLVNELLVLARADAGRNLNIAAFDPAPVLEETARQARILGPDRHISVQAQPGNLAMADKDATKQILLIGLDNALKHSRGSISLGLTSEGDWLRLSVQDDGDGVDPARLEHLFDRFYRGEDASTIPGFGLGLPIARSLAQSMGGDVTMESTPGQGSRLVISLPQAHN